MPKDCQTWTKWLNQDNTGFFQELAAVELGWNLEDDVAKASLRRRSPKALHAVYLGRPVRLVSELSGLCVGTKGGGKSKGTPLVQVACQEGDIQGWEFMPIDEVWYQLRHKASGMCADVGGRSKADKVGVNLFQCKKAGDKDQGDQLRPARPTRTCSSSSPATAGSAWTSAARPRTPGRTCSSSPATASPTSAGRSSTDPRNRWFSSQTLRV